MNALKKLSTITLLVVLTGCNESSTPNNASDHENFGQVGKGTASDLRGRHEHALLHWQKQRRILFLGIVKHEKDSVAPRFFIIGKLPPLKPGTISSSELDFGQGTDSSGLDMHVSASHGPKISYHLGADPDKEQLTIGEVDYDFGSGRIFLLDQAVNPATVVQIKTAWDTLFANDQMEFTREDYIAALEKLSSMHAEIREFLEGFEAE